MALESTKENKEKGKPEFNIQAYKHAISMIESSGGKYLETGINPETGKPYSSAAGKYHFLYKSIIKDPDMKGVSKREFMNDPDLQELIMDKALNGELEGYTYGIDYANKLKSKYNTSHSSEEIAALTHFLGAGGVQDYLKNPDFKVPGAMNSTGQQYADKFKRHYSEYTPPEIDSENISMPSDSNIQSKRNIVVPDERYTSRKRKSPSVSTSSPPRGMENINLRERGQAVSNSKDIKIKNSFIPQDVSGLAEMANMRKYGGYNKLVEGGSLSGEDKSAKPGVGAYLGAATGAMELGQMAFGPTGIDTSGSSPPPDVPSQGAAAASGMMKGAAAGAAFGPWGAAIGGGVGAVAGFVGQGKMKNDAEDASRQYDANIHNQASNSYDKGGDLNSQVNAGEGVSELVTMFENGGSHEQNSLGGIPQGLGANGKQNLVEEGETKWNDYVFSNSIDMDGNFTGEDGKKNNVFKNKNLFNIDKFKI
jgi:hypothetical protein